MPSYLGILLGLAALGTGIYLVAATKDDDPYNKSKKGTGIFLIILGTIMFIIGAVYEETYDPQSPTFGGENTLTNGAGENIGDNTNVQPATGVQQPVVVNTGVPVVVKQPNGNSAVGIRRGNQAAPPANNGAPPANNGAPPANNANNANNAARAAAQAAPPAVQAAPPANNANNAARAAAQAAAIEPAVESAVAPPGRKRFVFF